MQTRPADGMGLHSALITIKKEAGKDIKAKCAEFRMHTGPQICAIRLLSPYSFLGLITSVVNSRSVSRRTTYYVLHTYIHISVRRFPVK